MRKIYIGAEAYLHDSWRLAKQVLESGWKPDVMLALWRGGAPVGVAVHEFLAWHQVEFEHFPLKCRSYVNIGERSGRVEFECAEEVFAHIGCGRKVLVVDDVFDTGHTMEALTNRLLAKRCEVRTACVYWKHENNETSLSPDFFVRRINDWIIFPHEMQGLTSEELEVKDPFFYKESVL